MKKIFLILSLFVFLGIASPVLGFNFWENVPKPAGLKEKLRQERDSKIFSDAEFSQPVNRFLPGQMVYIRIKAQGSGDKEKTLRVLDSNKKEVQKITLEQVGSGPFVFTASFLAPDASGVYYVDIKIDNGQGSVFSSQENINVGDSDGSASVSSEAESVVVSTSSSVATLSGAEIVSEAGESASPSFFPIVGFFKKAFSQFLSFLSGIFRI